MVEYVSEDKHLGLSNGKRTEAANPPYGERGHFRKITITLPPEAYEKLISESARRKIAGEPNHLLSALLREAVDHYMPLLEGGVGAGRNA